MSFMGERVRIFIDTWGWVTLRDRREARHEEVVRFYQNFRKGGGLIYTSDYVLDETITLLFKRQHFSLAEGAVNYLEQAVDTGYLLRLWITPERFERALTLRRRFQDKPRISFTDLTSMVVMTEYEITQVLTEDNHFMQVGLGLQVVP
jgi:predicted nucleic acid-binding protein